MKKILIFLLFIPLIAACSKSEKTSLNDDTLLYNKIAELGASGAYKEAIDHADSVLRLQLSDSLRAYVMLERMVAMGNMGDMRQAAAYSDTVIEFGRENNIDEVIINALTIKGAGYRRRAVTDSALIYYQQALDLAIGGVI